MKIKKIDKYFIAAIELIYSIIFAVGVYKALLQFEVFMKMDLTEKITIVTGGIISLFILIRFFFAPTRNVLLAVQKDTRWPLGHKRWILLLDVSILMTHAFVYYFICIFIAVPIDFYRSVAILLLLNTLWLWWIWVRVREDAPKYIKLWSCNNLFFGIFLFLAIKWVYPATILNIQCKILILFTLALSNCVIDLWNTWDAYLSTVQNSNNRK